MQAGLKTRLYQRAAPARDPSSIGWDVAREGGRCYKRRRRELGLKLVRERASVNDFIIERVEPLIEN
jgi:hypothetical protein